jgi:hypothetical protein
MTGRPASTRPNQRRPEAHAAMARVFGVNVEPGEASSWDSTAPEPATEDAERRAALGRVFGTEA